MSDSGFRQTEQQKTLDAVREFLLSDEFIEELSARIIDRTADAPIDGYQIIRDTKPINESSNDGT